MNQSDSFGNLTGRGGYVMIDEEIFQFYGSDHIFVDTIPLFFFPAGVKQAEATGDQ